ncbi:MAG: glycosyltransferase family 2 protein [Chloroflexi bacterium]|nr:glycosyltransferase family 2 protein [Chloroflexota bacterium]
MGSRITAAVITFRERQHIQVCLACLTWADELLVVDAYSPDDTAARAQEAGARVLQRPFDTFPRQRNYALQEATGDWVLFVDADERVEAPLAQAVQATVRSSAAAGEDLAGAWIPRQNLILGRWVRHGGWWPDYQLRLLRRGRARYDEAQDPHEVVVVDGPTRYLDAPLVHHNYVSWGQLLDKQRDYALREARTLRRRDVRALPHRFVTQPAREFYRRLMQLQGFRDGPLGLLLALVMAWYTLKVYVNLRRLERFDPGDPQR